MIEKTLLGKIPFGGEIFYLYSDRPYDIPAVRIFVSMQKTIREIVKEQIDTTEDFITYVNKHPEVSKRYVRSILRYHHGDIGEMESYGFYLRSVSRLLAFLGWVPIGGNRGIKGVGTELSLRYFEQKKGSINLPDERLNKTVEESGELYGRLRGVKMRKEDARHVLTLSSKTEEIMHIQIGRDLAKWANHLWSQPFEEAKSVGEILSKWNEKENGFSLPMKEMPVAKMPLLYKDEDNQRSLLQKFLADKPRRIHYDPYMQSLVWNSKRSIASFHQDIRNRQVYFWWPSWESAIGDDDFHTPPGLSKELREEIQEHFNSLIDLSNRFWRTSNYQLAVYAIPLGKRIDVFCALYGNGNIYETIRLRACMRAQTEIRNQYRLIAETIKKNFPGKLGARCETEGICFEPRKEKCPLWNSRPHPKD